MEIDAADVAAEAVGQEAGRRTQTSQATVIRARAGSDVGVVEVLPLDVMLLSCVVFDTCQERPYHSDSTASRLLSEVKHCRARLVLRWGTTLESLVLIFCSFLPLFNPCFCSQAKPYFHLPSSPVSGAME
eukprot:scaffold7967_cov81-Skeletonema_dohrnii-CCMP3373.AAC.2